MDPTNAHAQRDSKEPIVRMILMSVPKVKKIMIIVKILDSIRMMCLKLA